MRICVVIIAAILLHLHCGGSIQSAGGSSTAGNGVVAGVLYNENGSPVSGASVYLYLSDGELSADTATDSTRSDKNGGFSFRSVASGRYIVLAKNVSEYEFTAFSGVDVGDEEETDLDPLVLTDAGTVAGQLGFSVDSSWTVFAAVKGTPLNDTLEDYRTFSIPSVPSGVCSLIVYAYTPVSGEINCIGYEYVNIVDGVPERSVTVNRLVVTEGSDDTLLLDSFDDGDKMLANRRTTWWQYTGGDADGYDSTSVAADFGNVTGWDGTGYCAHVKAEYDAENNAAFVGFGCMITNRVLSYHNLFTMENLKEIKFRIKGSPVRCEVVLFSPPYTAYNTIHVMDSLPEEWMHVVIDIPAAVENMDDNASEYWNTSGVWIEQITFNFFKRDRAVTMADFYIDDVIFIFDR